MEEVLLLGSLGWISSGNLSETAVAKQSRTPVPMKRVLPLLFCMLWCASGASNDSTLYTKQRKEPLVMPLLTHSAMVERRRLEGLSTEIVNSTMRKQRSLTTVAPLYQGIGTHYVDLWVGTPNPQRQTVIVDTGSGVTAFPCTGCNSCGQVEHHIDDVFFTDRSTSFQELGCKECLAGRCGRNQCQVSRMYSEGSSWSAHECSDMVYAGGLHDTVVQGSTENPWNPGSNTDLTFRLKFGCQTSVTKLFLTQWADGIMGMNKSPSAYWKQLVQAKGLENEFSLCFAQHSDISRDGTQAGGMTLGGFSTKWHRTPMVYASLGGNSGGGFFGIHVRNMYMVSVDWGEEDSLLRVQGWKEKAVRVPAPNDYALNGRKAIVDSGTTDTYFPSVIRDAFHTAFKEVTNGLQWNEHMTLTDEQVNHLPSIVVQIDGDEELNKDLGPNFPGLAGNLDPNHPNDVLIVIPPAHYLIYITKTKTHETGIFQEGSETVLGANTMMGHDVWFGPSLGVAESDCDYDRAMKEFGGEAPHGTKPNQESDPSRQESPKQPLPSSVDKEESGNGICSTPLCHFGAATGVLLGVVLLVSITRKHRQTVTYHQAGLELAQVSTEELADAGTGYRDEKDDLALREMS